MPTRSPAGCLPLFHQLPKNLLFHFLPEHLPAGEHVDDSADEHADEHAVEYYEEYAEEHVRADASAAWRGIQHAQRLL